MVEGTTTIVIYGASSDLVQRKLVPALFNLRCKGRLPEGLRIVGLSRTEYSDDQFRELAWKGAREIGELTARRDEWELFARNFFYVCDDLCLFSEQIDAETGEMLGNFPQAFTHMAVINTVVQLHKALLNQNGSPQKTV